MSARRPNRRQNDPSNGGRWTGAVVRACGPHEVGLLDLAVQMDSSMIFPVLSPGDLSDALVSVRLLGVDALGGVFQQNATGFEPLSVSSFHVTFDAGPQPIDADKPWALYLPAQSPLYRPAAGGVVRGWLDPAQGSPGPVEPAGWIVCSTFVL